MNASFTPRGACPTLLDPMPTGDGLLARLRLAEGGFSPAQLAGLMRAAHAHGNGIVEITRRGSLQIRGLSDRSGALLAQKVDRLGIVPREGVPVETSPLARLDPTELTDAVPLATDIRASLAAAGLAEKLGPKVSVVVDGGGMMPMTDVMADVRLDAVYQGAQVMWRLGIGGTAGEALPVGFLHEADAPAAVVRLLAEIAAGGRKGRGRDLTNERIEAALAGIVVAKIGALSVDPPTSTAAEGSAERPLIGTIASREDTVLALALPFGQAKAGQLEALAEAAHDESAAEIRLGLHHGVLILCAPDAAVALTRTAQRLGFITHDDDPRLRVSACAGAPGCASGHLDTRALAAALAPALPPGTATVHLSGCAKRCAEPRASLTVTGDAKGVSVDGASPVAQKEALAAIAHSLDSRLAAESGFPPVERAVRELPFS